jgi:hypothetical protein
MGSCQTPVYDFYSQHQCLLAALRHGTQSPSKANIVYERSDGVLLHVDLVLWCYMTRVIGPINRLRRFYDLYQSQIVKNPVPYLIIQPKERRTAAYMAAGLDETE